MGICALVEHGGKDQVLVLVRSDQPLTIRLVHRYRLLHQYVVTRLQCRDAYGCVRIVRGGDQDRVAHAIL